VRLLAAEGATVVAGARTVESIAAIDGVTGFAVDLAEPGGPEALIGSCASTGSSRRPTRTSRRRSGSTSSPPWRPGSTPRPCARSLRGHRDGPLQHRRRDGDARRAARLAPHGQRDGLQLRDRRQPRQDDVSKERPTRWSGREQASSACSPTRARKPGSSHALGPGGPQDALVPARQRAGGGS